jgi:hypothetical protein
MYDLTVHIKAAFRPPSTVEKEVTDLWWAEAVNEYFIHGLPYTSEVNDGMKTVVWLPPEAIERIVIEVRSDDPHQI